ncbi:Acyl-CoA-binding domain-containing protein 2 [Coemansia sp. RSA 2322]|uniref:Acyl-CoA-binding domain-containing protein 2 n=1 Tax=Coemansia thaxteri TaxID=2663907 RepID=A0A9W8EK56_9FUNG|nr:Acyl-CoA-binding domain-containing protein 2 [Coemansia thaxteri]KAJ2468630.1 Acyl-CoA-binding domain-containing protein 2 [Coemansia sp. RSA 2322]KAJ2484009.1 Acyl-CoA-binding domain-containing protein 2 [Coemansia sp. RSA 2320]
MSSTEEQRKQLTEEQKEVLFAEFEDFADKATRLPSTPNQSQQLALYGLYKQGKFGDDRPAPPGMFDLKAKAKFKAWLAHENKEKEVAQEEYIALVKSLIEEYGEPTEKE